MKRVNGGDGGIRTHGTLLGYAHLANESLRPLGHVSVGALVQKSGGCSKVRGDELLWFCTIYPFEGVSDGGLRARRAKLASQCSPI